MIGQTLTQTQKLVNPSESDNFRQGYTFAYAVSGTPWNGSLISFGGLNNNYDTQFSADYGPHGGRHISYRTRNGDVNVWNPWRELLSKESNGNVGIGTDAPDQLLTLKSNAFMGWEYNGTGSGSYHTITGGGLNPMSFSDSGAPIFKFNGFTNTKMVIMNSGNVGIGVDSPQNKLDVNGTIHAKEVKVDMQGWADYVFESGYKLPSLESVEEYIKSHGHLPDVASEKEVLENGIHLCAHQVLMLQKIEELTLYMIEQNRLNQEQSDLLKQQQEEIENLKLELQKLKKII